MIVSLLTDCAQVQLTVMWYTRLHAVNANLCLLLDGD